MHPVPARSYEITAGKLPPRHTLSKATYPSSPPLVLSPSGCDRPCVACTGPPVDMIGAVLPEQDPQWV